MKNINLVIISLFLFSSCSTYHFSSYEKDIISKTDETGKLRVFLVENPEDSIILYKKSKKIKAKAENSELKAFTQALFNIVKDPNKPGVGIAAPQVGINRMIIWVQRFDKEGAPFEIYFNIRILNYSDEVKPGMEGCLSVDNYRGTVNRSAEITVKYDTFTEKNKQETIKGFTAVIFQHEIDHLNGILYTDRITDKKLLVREN